MYNKHKITVMPAIGLVFTSIGFIIPALFAKHKKHIKDAKIITTLTVSSVLYHGTLHPMAHFFDMIVAHSVAINYLCRGIKNLVDHRRRIHAFGMLFGCMSTHIYYNKSLPIKNDKLSRKWHMKVHATAQVALLAFILGNPKRIE